MGPLYHLLQETERQQALQEAYRVIEPGGQFWAAFISRYATLRYAAAHDPMWPINYPAVVNQVLETGILPPRGEWGDAFVAFFQEPEGVRPLLQSAGFEVSELLGVEGLVSMIEDQINELQDQSWDRWLDLNYCAAADPSLLAGVEHLLAIATRPRWKMVLCQLAARLRKVGIDYCIVGGTSVALHGVPILVRDIDIELSAQDAYRFQELFPNNVVLSVALRESDKYRSHFGRFDFEGVPVEVMGELERREDKWMSTMAQTRTEIELEGIPLSVSWLEEETLAYMRRGRLERAAECLSRCDSHKLYALLHGNTKTGVF